MVISQPYLIGLTGNIACGKSTVLQELARLGAAVLDADAVVHQLLKQPGPTRTAVVKAFGSNILGPDGAIDRKILGQIVFQDPTALSRLESIVHPAVLDFTWTWLEQVATEVAVIDAIKLIEAGMAERCDEVWVVTCPQEEQIHRLMENRGLSREEALQRIRAQPPQEEKVARADVVIDNRGRLEETQTQVLRSWNRLTLKHT